MKKNIQKYLILSFLFFFPIFIYIFLASGINNFAKLPILTTNVLDIENIIKDPFRLEISSAGIDRYLSSLDDFMKYKNYNVKVKSETYTGRGKLVNYDPSSLTLSNKNGEKCIDLSSVIEVKLDLEGMSLETIKEMEFK